MSHLHDKIDFSTTAFVVYNDKVLLRLHEKYNRWFGVGGHVELHEDPSEAVIREAKEESGLDVEIISANNNAFADGSVDLPLPMFLNRHRINDDHEHVDFMYAVRSNNDVIEPAENEVANPESFRWFTEQELLDSDVEERVKHHALTALKLAKQND